MEPIESRSVVATDGRAAGWGIAAALVLLLAVLLAASRSTPPPPKPAGAPPGEFSAARATAVLRDLEGDGSPHPVGSPAAARVRDRIVAHLRSLGYAPEVQEGAACNAYGSCARVRNVLARLAGREPGKSVLLLAHYDSIGAGPGAGDDLSGVAAILEVARVLKATPPPRHGVLLLLDEGEEPGLLGARSFLAQSPAAAEVGAVVNLEARGTAGPSLLFETSGGDAWMISRYAGHASHPFASSLFATLYQYLPNDTDLTVFKRRGIPGVNFAFIGRPSLYHTALDDLSHLSPASLQHQGDNALAAVRGLAEADLASPPPGRAVFFDLFHATLVRWPAGLSPLLGLLALALTLAAAFLARRRGLEVWGLSFVLGAVAAPAALLCVAILGFAVQMLLASAFPIPWVAHPGPAIAAFWLISFGATLALAGWLGGRGSLPGLWTGVWTFWSVLGILLGLLLPGVSYLVLVPALVAGVCGLALGGSLAGRTAAAVLPTATASLVWFPVISLLYLGLGLTGLLVTAVLLALGFSTLTPLLAGAGSLWRRWLPLAGLALGVLFAVWALASPPFGPDSPRPLIVQAHEDALSGETRWLVRAGGPLPPAMRQAAAFGDAPPAPAFPWSPPFARAFAAPAPRLNAPGPELAVLADSAAGGKRHLRLRLTSPRGARVAALFVPAGAKLESIRIDGLPVEEGETGRRGAAAGPAPSWNAYTQLTLPPQGSELDVVLGATQPMDWYVADRTDGLPPAAQALLAARPPNAVPAQEGNTTLVSRKVRI